MRLIIFLLLKRLSEIMLGTLSLWALALIMMPSRTISRFNLLYRSDFLVYHYCALLVSVARCMGKKYDQNIIEYNYIINI